MKMRARLFLHTWLRVLATLCCGVAQFGAAGAEKTPASFPDYLSLPMMRGRQGQPLLRAKINDRSALLYLDTGSPVTCVDESQARAYGLAALAGGDRAPLTVNANGSDHHVTLIPRLGIGALRLENTPAVLIDFREINRAIRAGRDKPSDAILGLETLAGAKAVVDLPGSRLLIKTRSEAPDTIFAETLKAGGWTEIPMHLNEGHLAIETVINHTPAELLVDTGSPATVLDRGFVRAHPFPLTRGTFSSRGIHFQDSAVRVGRVRSLWLGSFPAGAEPVAVFDLSRLLGLARNTKTPMPDGLIGCETLLRCHAWIDCERMKLYLRR